ncbi:MAG TPA: hypothetical protein G4O03_00665 [Dehalococcoidia bacterium]|jgi:hypothetical protein|nr:hypothetical protein [Dehalococcoidia bacterium]
MRGQPSGTQQLSLLEPQRNLVDGRAAELAARIRKGNHLLWERWRLIGDMQPGKKQERFLAGWDRGVERLRKLCDELASLDGRCAYEEQQPTDPCLACSVPNEQWSKDRCPAWKLEL